MADSTSDTTARAQRSWLYTNLPNAFPGLGDLDDPLFHLTMDTWYYSEWADPNHWASFGTLPLGDGPLRGQGVAAFVARQVALFLDAFSGVFRPTAVRVWYKPQLTGVVHHAFGFSAPETQEDVQAIQSALEQSAYDGIDWLTIDFEVGATVRDEDGHFTQIWLPYAGTAHYHAHYTDGYSSDPPKYGAVTYLLTPEAKGGMVPWAVDLHCRFVSLFRETNADILTRARDYWQRWLQAHPAAANLGQVEEEDEDAEAEGESEEDAEDFVVSLVVPPPGTPHDNRDIAARNTPRLRAAIAQWEGSLSKSFEWAVTPWPTVST